jgi:uncharacterized protein YjbJ (UPF0337 family)
MLAPKPRCSAYSHMIILALSLNLVIIIIITSKNKSEWSAIIGVLGRKTLVEDRDPADRTCLGNLCLIFCQCFEHSLSVSDSALNFDNHRLRIDPFALVGGAGFKRRMHQEEISGKSKQIKGKVRTEVGKITGNRREQVKGKIEQVQGKAEERLGKAKKRAGKN